MSEDAMTLARELAGQCWCDPETSMIEMDVRLAEAFSRRYAVLLEQSAFEKGVLKTLSEGVLYRDAEIAALKARVETLDLIVTYMISVSMDEDGSWIATVQRRWGSYPSATGKTIHEAVQGAVKNAGLRKRESSDD